jgi:glucans biosynthesis protein C
VDRLARLCELPGVIYLLNLPSIVAAMLLVPHWPTTNNLVADWANFASSLIIFLWGFTICGSSRFLDLIERRRREFLCVSAVMLVLFYGIRVTPAVGRLPGWAQLVVFLSVDSYFGLAVILALVGWSRAKLNRDSAALRYANTAVYPFYIVHQTITILLAYSWLGWNVPFAVKFPALFAGTFLGSWLCYEVVRRTRVTRVLFGMKP